MNTSERHWLSFELIEKIINSFQHHNGRRAIEELDDVNLDRLTGIENNILRGHKGMTMCYAEWMTRVALAYQEKFAGMRVDEAEMSYWIRLQALAHTIVDQQKDFPPMPDQLLWEEDEDGSLDVQKPTAEQLVATEEEKSLEQRVKELEQLTQYLLQENKRLNAALTSQKSILPAHSTS